jgi:hypothetical protein
MSEDMPMLDHIKNKKTFIELFDYEGAVRTLARTKNDKKHLCTGQEKGAIVLSNILTESNSTFKIITDSFESEMFNDDHQRVKSALNDFILRGGKVDVIMNKSKESENSYAPVIDLLEEHMMVQPYRENINIYVTNEEAFVQNYQSLFAIGDDRMYRWEYDIALKLAQFSFNNVDVCSELNHIFSDILERATKLDFDYCL